MSEPNIIHLTVQRVIMCNNLAFFTFAFDSQEKCRSKGQSMTLYIYFSLKLRVCSHIISRVLFPNNQDNSVRNMLYCIEIENVV